MHPPRPCWEAVQGLTRIRRCASGRGLASRHCNRREAWRVPAGVTVPVGSGPGCAAGADSGREKDSEVPVRTETSRRLRSAH
eukprot:3784745-Rhodomonas_salina.2